MSDRPRRLPVTALTREAFRPFGDVLEAVGAPDDLANAGAAQVFRDRAEADFLSGGGRIAFNIVRTAPRAVPLEIALLERHPLSSQTFSPLGGGDWLVVVAPAGELDPHAIVAFRATSRQAINYRRGVWHHPLIALGEVSDFLVIDRVGEGANLDLERLAEPLLIDALP